MTKQIKIVLTEHELKLLSQSASQQCRRPHDQARYLLLAGLGLLSGQQQLKENTTVPNVYEAQHGGVTVNP